MGIFIWDKIDDHGSEKVIKSDLQNGMVVKTSGGRYGVVCLKDATNENVIKFLYDPRLLRNNGFIHEGSYGPTIVSLDDFEEDLTIRVFDDELQERLIVWSIDEVYSLDLIQARQ
ncbi:hypothetical protein EBB07_29025 [Paenibacillaceae bacterium]|nr:hypothetical protein EBB07_29025 [Paenibacillaceae bacterium]